MTQSDQDPRDTILEGMGATIRDLLTSVGYNHTRAIGSNSLDSQDPQVASNLGKLFHDYFIDMENGVDGFTDLELRAIATFLKDVALYSNSVNRGNQ